MTTITSTGTNSGLDISQIITDLMAAERKTPTARLDTKEAKLQAQLSGIGTFKGAVSDFQSALASVNNATSLQSLSATASDDSLFSATTTSVAQAGTYDIKVTQLAQAQKLVANASFSSVSDVVGTGTLTFTFGTTTYTSGTPSGFSADTSKAAKTVTIDASNNTLSGMRDAINNSNIGVRANIIYDGTGYRLSLGATDSGVANSLKISVTDTGDGNDTDTLGLSRLAYDPTATMNMTENLAAQSAILTLDGLTITSASNSVVGAVPGVTLNLKKAQASGDSSATLTVAQDSTTVSAAIESFVTAYNTLMSTTKTLTAYDATTGEKGALLGDSTVRSITSQIRRVLTSAVTGTTGTVRTLYDVGVSLQRDGTLEFDSTKLQTALESDPEAIASLFSRASRASDSLVSVNSTSSTSTAGTYAINITQLATQAQYAGSNISAPFVVTTGVNDTVALTINGKSANITLSQNLSGYSGTDLATELQSKINSVSALANAGITVSVGYASGKLTFTTSTYGSASRIVFGSGNANATLGVSNGATATGVDVAGTIGSSVATGVGQKLTGMGVAAGIAVDILGGATGSRGTVSLSNGIAYQLDNLLSDFLSSDGLLSHRTEGINRQVDQITDQRAALETRMTALEARYTAQFQAMDALIGKLNVTSTFLTQQFASKSS